MCNDLIAVIDVGKTNAKLFLVEAVSGEIVWTAQRPNPAIPTSPLLQLDVLGVEAWLLRKFAAAPRKDEIRRIVPIAHGAAAVLIDASDKVLLAPDYEDVAFNAKRDEYALERDSFASTFSPHLPFGLNLGTQLHYLEMQRPEIFRNVAHILLLPQFFAWRLSGVMASEVTSLGCHTDLWRPLEGCFSLLAERWGWARLLPPMRAASDVLGPVRRKLAASVGLHPDCRVICGIHDSNASFLAHLYRRPAGRPFAVVSSGTWTVAMASNVDLRRLRQERDMLANVDAFGTPVGTARFMGGREYQAIVGDHEAATTPTASALRSVLGQGAMALPTFAKTGGPFQGKHGRLVGAAGLNATERAALATLYVALVTNEMLDLLGAAGDLIIDGPLAINPMFAPILAAFRPASSVRLGDTAVGAASGGPALALGARRSARGRPPQAVVHPLMIEGLAAHQRQWRENLSA